MGVAAQQIRAPAARSTFIYRTLRATLGEVLDGWKLSAVAAAGEMRPILRERISLRPGLFLRSFNHRGTVRLGRPCKRDEVTDSSQEPDFPVVDNLSLR